MSVEAHLAELEKKHRALDSAIEQELAHAGADPLKIASLKRRKLLLKDEIMKLRQDMTPRTVH
jgi:hypothetical protein